MWRIEKNTIKWMLPLALGILIMVSGNNSSAQQPPSGCPAGGYAIVACPVVTDEVIRSAVMARLAGSIRSAQNPILVQVCNGVVTLTGMVQTRSQWDMATILAFSVRGVTCVNNKLIISPVNATDLEILGHVKDALTKAGLNGQRIHASVNNGAVELTGIVHNEIDREIATNIVSSVPGVKAVYNNITVLDTNVPGWVY